MEAETCILVGRQAETLRQAARWETDTDRHSGRDWQAGRSADIDSQSGRVRNAGRQRQKQFSKGGQADRAWKSGRQVGLQRQGSRL
jgi:hypothetical protein